MLKHYKIQYPINTSITVVNISWRLVDNADGRHHETQYFIVNISRCLELNQNLSLITVGIFLCQWRETCLPTFMYEAHLIAWTKHEKVSAKDESGLYYKKDLIEAVRACFWLRRIRSFSSENPCWFWMTIFSAVSNVRSFHSGVKKPVMVVRGLRIKFLSFPLPSFLQGLPQRRNRPFHQFLCRLCR